MDHFVEGVLQFTLFFGQKLGVTHSVNEQNVGDLEMELRIACPAIAVLLVSRVSIICP